MPCALAVLVLIAGCAAPATGPLDGVIEVTISVRGGNSSAGNGFHLLIDGENPGPLRVDGTGSFPVVAGEHTVELAGLVSGCAVTGGAARTTLVGQGSTVRLDFEITCGQVSPEGGALTVRAVTRGVDKDPNGYTVVIDDTARGSLARNGVLVVNLPTAQHRVTLADLTPNCAIPDSAQRTLEVTRGGTPATTFEVSCNAAPSMGPGKEIAFALFRGYGLDSLNRAHSDIVVMNVDGTGVRRPFQTPEAAQRHPTWSRDGTKLAFVGEETDGTFVLSQKLYIASIQASGELGQPIALPAEGIKGGLTWSTDNARLAFSYATPRGEEIVITGISEFKPKSLTPEAGAFRLNPSWSPDGRWIIYERRDHPYDPDFGFELAELWVVGADGSQPERPLSTPPILGVSPAWSPDGTRIAFAAPPQDSRFSNVYVANTDGSQPVRVTYGSLGDASPTWSPDGEAIAFSSPPDDPFAEIYVTPLDSWSPLRLTHAESAVFGEPLTPSWRP